jgi:hypothetical protein
MLHQDGSRHRWLQGEAALDLIVTMDDATSTIYSAFLVEEEGTASTLRGLLEVFVVHGLPCALYSDRGSHYFYTDKAGEAVDKGRRTQVGRALDRLGIDHIPAYSPEARGRSERMFGTLQDRLVKELAHAGIGGIETANRWTAKSICRPTMLASPSRRRSPRRPSLRLMPRFCARRCAARISAWSDATIRWPMGGCGCSCRRAVRAPITSRQA